MNMLVKLFFAFIQVGLFSVGGGYAAIPLIQAQIVNIHRLMSMEEFTDLITIAEMTPGPIAVNAATFVGQRLGGMTGAIVCTLGCITPSLIIVLLLSWLYCKYKNLDIVQGVLGGLRPAIISMIAGAACTIFILAVFNSDLAGIQLDHFHGIEFLLFAVGLFLLRKFRLNPILIIFGSGIAGTLLYAAADLFS